MMEIFKQVTGVSPEFSLTRSGDSVTVSFHYDLYGWESEEDGFIVFEGEAYASLGDASGSAYQSYGGDRPLFIDFTANLTSGVTYAGEYQMEDWGDGTSLSYAYSLTLFSSQATFAGTTAVDIVFGSVLADRLVTYGGNDFIEADAGDDSINSGDGNDVVFGGSGNDVILAGIGRDILMGGDGGDKLYGGTGDDALNGGLNSDYLQGDGGNDTLLGGLGADILFGGIGADRLTGGDNKDAFVFKSITDSTAASSGRDTILDFDRLEGDKIDLSVIDANTKLSGNQAFKFLGSAAYTKTAGELRTVVKNGDTFIYGDVNGDGATDFSIMVNTSARIYSTDFIL